MYHLMVELPELHSKNTILKQIKQIACLPSLRSDVKHIYNTLENAFGLKWIKCVLHQSLMEKSTIVDRQVMPTVISPLSLP